MEARILKTRTDVDTASPGLYIVRSGTEAYFPVRGLIEDDLAKFRGEFFDEDAQHVITVELTSKPALPALRGLGNPPTQRSITIGREFFITALKDYSDWNIKWWREAVQNSVDAGGQNIHLGATVQENGDILVYCDDDGRGMDEDTIINKFLVLGATTKVAGSGAAGGFGKAKELILLPWIAWSLHSRDRIVEGAGIDYSIKEAPYRQGTRLEVLMAPDKMTDGPVAIGFLEKCYLPHINFTVNGKPIQANLRGEVLVTDIPDKAEIYFTPSSQKSSYMYVRTKGLYMFSRYIGEVPGHILAELTGPSIELLTANRDGFRDYTTARGIESWAEKFAKDTMSALKNKAGMIRKKYLGTGKFRAKRVESALLEEIGPSTTKLSESSVDRVTEALSEYAKFEQERGAAADIVSSPGASMIAAMLDQRYRGASHIEAAIKQLVWQPDFFLINEIEDYKVPKKFFPETMTPRVHKLIKSWTELCRYVMMQLGSTEPFGVGFVFSHTMGAAALPDEDDDNKTSWLMINPFKNVYDRDAIWSPSQEDDLKWLYAAAIHECTHIADDMQYHDESFAAALTRNMARCADGYRKIRQIVGAIRGQGGLEADTDKED